MLLIFDCCFSLPKNVCLVIVFVCFRKFYFMTLSSCGLTYKQKIHLWSSPYLRIIQYILNSTQQKKKNEKLKLNKIKFSCGFNKIRMYFWQIIVYPLAVNIWLFVAFCCQRMSVLLSFSFVLESSTLWPRVLY
jgi:hypothetical protein